MPQITDELLKEVDAAVRGSVEGSGEREGEGGGGRGAVVLQTQLPWHGRRYAGTSAEDGRHAGFGGSAVGRRIFRAGVGDSSHR